MRLLAHWIIHIYVLTSQSHVQTGRTHQHDVPVWLFPPSVSALSSPPAPKGSATARTFRDIWQGVVTGIWGNVLAESICRIFRIQEPIAKGLAIGTSSHAIGTAKAMEIGEVEGAMSSLAIAVAGLMTVVGASVFANLM